MTMRLLCMSAAAVVFCAGVAAVPQHFSTPEEQLRYRGLIKELRCVVCQNQNLAESNADLAADMRAIIADMVRAQTSDEEIIEFMSARYGDFVRYRPPLSTKTAALWILPFVVLLAALLWLPTLFRRRHISISAAERQKAEHILNEKP